MTTLLPSLSSPGPAPTGSASPVVIAHRGNSSVAPQNTLAALESAWRAQAHAVEIDVQLTADGEVVVIHDDTVDATTDGTGAVAGLALGALRALDAGVTFSPAYAGQRIPTFAEVLDLLAARPGTDLLLELKGSWAADDARTVTDAIDVAGLADRVVVQSFHPETVAALRDVAPHLPRGWLVHQQWDRLLEVAAELEVVACNPYVGMVLEDPALVQRLHDAGLRVMTWTANDAEQWAGVLAAGVDAVITDRPDRLAGWLEGRATAAAPTPATPAEARLLP
ncbi:glycerophosphodiester phosphodiesterase [Puerhibacterium puerhi]|uniref:glycerophosphodiester phosphodiesterase n=1 Tax=Puerhibacterium puerhi TaxID=2692623 RepID=UPI001F21931F|nr:glycerophosphodiester phosphodiesterase family protein [Puerhibacterium puerhi]